jgi:PLP dependent protein
MHGIDLEKNWNEVKARIEVAAEKSGRDSQEITLINVSKTKPVDMLLDAWNAGIRIFGENYAQELVDKYQYFNEKGLEPTWNFIGRLQTNKVKYIAPFVAMIHSVGSLKLAKEIGKQAAKHDRIIDVLLQVNTSGELSKSGCDPESFAELADEVLKIDNINVCGMMTIGSFSEDEEIYRREFRLLKKLRDAAAEKHGEKHFKHLSMGMTHDFEHAIEEGATIVRVGTAIFGERIYKK